MFYSFVMGMDNSIFELKQQGFLIESVGNNYQVSFPKEKTQVWEEFIKK